MRSRCRSSAPRPSLRPGLGIIAAIIMLAFGLWWLRRAEAAARGPGRGLWRGAIGGNRHRGQERDSYVSMRLPPASSIPPRSRMAPTARTRPALDRGVAAHRRHVMNLLMSLFILPRIDILSWRRSAGAHVALGVAGVWAVVTALATASAVTFSLVNCGRLRSLARKHGCRRQRFGIACCQRRQPRRIWGGDRRAAGIRGRARLGAEHRGRPAGLACRCDEHTGGADRIGIGRPDDRPRRACRDLSRISPRNSASIPG